MNNIAIAKKLLPLPDLLGLLGLGEHAKKSARCPFHDDQTPSFGIYTDANGELRWKCHAGCGGGDGVDFIAKLENRTEAEACRRYITIAGARGDVQRVARAPRKATAPGRALLPREIYDPTEEECKAAIRKAEALSRDSCLCERIAKRRNWRPETIRTLALEGYLGWSDSKLAFIYDTGVKLRWRQNGERIIRWAFGKPWIWRGAWLRDAQTVYLCESETDAISLIDAGFEHGSGHVVVATPSASTFKSDWVRLFSGKDVVLSFDNDHAGRAATVKLSKLLKGHTRSLCRVNWEGKLAAGE